MNVDLAGRTALVTSSPAGIGFAIAHGPAVIGVTIVVNGRSQPLLNRALAGLAEAVPQVPLHGVVADVGAAQGRARRWSRPRRRWTSWSTTLDSTARWIFSKRWMQNGMSGVRLSRA